MMSSLDPEFGTWFAGSAVADAEGRPVIMYHGTTKEFLEFHTGNGSEMGAHFGTKAQAESFSHKPGGRVIPVVLAIKNPLRLEDRGWFTADQVVPQLKARGVVSPMFSARQIVDIQRAIEAAGFDGIVYLNRREGDHDPFGPDGVDGNELDLMTDAEVLELFPDAQDSFIAFRSEQVRGAQGLQCGRKDVVEPTFDLTAASLALVRAAPRLRQQEEPAVMPRPA